MIRYEYKFHYSFMAGLVSAIHESPLVPSPAARKAWIAGSSPVTND